MNNGLKELTAKQSPVIDEALRLGLAFERSMAKKLEREVEALKKSWDMAKGALYAIGRVDLIEIIEEESRLG